MSDLKLYLPTKEEEESPQIYVNKKLVPLAAELHRLTNEFISRGVTEENSDIDMVSQHNGRQFNVIDSNLHTVKPKMVKFSIGNEPLEKNGKLAKVLFRALVYSDTGEPVAFRLSKYRNGKCLDWVRGSVFQISNKKPEEISLYLPLGEQNDKVSAREGEYVIESRYLTNFARGVCRRFSLSVVYA